MVLVKNWKELSEIPANNKYRILIKDYCGWIVPVCDNFSEDNAFECNCSNDIKTTGEFWKHHVYLSTHTFYGSQYKQSTKIFQEHGFDIEIDNWDKEVKK